MIFPKIQHQLFTISQIVLKSLTFSLNQHKSFYIPKAIIKLFRIKMAPDMPSVLTLPESVRGMKELIPANFEKCVTVPMLEVDPRIINIVSKLVKPYLLKVDNFKPIQNSDVTGKCNILLHPDKIKTFDDMDNICKEKLISYGVSDVNLTNTEVTLGYSNFKADDILQAVLPRELPFVRGYSIVGHIIHLNLRSGHQDFKNIIGQVLLDKHRNIKTVVNKMDTINSEYRFFEMEILAGLNETVTKTKCNNVNFEFDFAKVYWNPRLGTEHSRIVSLLERNNILFDVFAGVGPFAIPGAKKCQVYANDLNPESYKWLCHNAKLNKVSTTLATFNMDGREFIKDILQPKLLEAWGKKIGNIHVVMNLPAIAIEFLDAFKGLCNIENINEISNIVLPTIHCYCFCPVNENMTNDIKNLVEEKLSCILSDEDFKLHYVRNVSPKKEMMRATFKLPQSVLFGTNDTCTLEPAHKKIKIV